MKNIYSLAGPDQEVQNGLITRVKIINIFLYNK